MPVTISPYAPDHVSQVREFNRRIAAKTDEFQLPESPSPSWLPRRDGIPLYQEYYLALDGQAVRGGYIFKPQAFDVAGETRMVANLRLPISEGIVDSRFGMVGPQVIKDAMIREPLLFAL